MAYLARQILLNNRMLELKRVMPLSINNDLFHFVYFCVNSFQDKTDDTTDKTFPTPAGSPVYRKN
jgi:hypothetical protein